jgi:predicted RNase H-like HicB family nuclease
MRFAILIEKAEGNYSAYVPDLPGCVATGPTVEAVKRGIREAIRFHIEGLEQDGHPVPPRRASRNMSRLEKNLSAELGSAERIRLQQYARVQRWASRRRESRRGVPYP